MADVKISALPASTTPLAGTEVLPIVQSSTTKQVSVANLTAGRAISASSLTLTTPLTVANGGTGTSTAFTAGSVVFAGASGVYSQSNSNLFWDNTNNRLGIGTSSPAQTLRVTGASGSAQAGFGTADNAVFVNAYDNASIYMTASAANSTSFGFGAASNISLFFMTDNTGRMWIDSSGNVGIAQTAPNNYLCIGPSTSTTGAPTYTGFLRLGSHPSQSLSSNGGLEFVAATGSNGYGFRICGIDLGSGSAPLVFQYRAASATWSEALRIDQNGNVIAASGTATPANGSTSARLLFGTTAGFGIYYGSGAPTVSAAQGSIYLRSDGSSTSTRLYVNTDGSTTWTNVTTAA